MVWNSIGLAQIILTVVAVAGMYLTYGKAVQLGFVPDNKDQTGILESKFNQYKRAQIAFRESNTEDDRAKYINLSLEIHDAFYNKYLDKSDIEASNKKLEEVVKNALNKV
ncbi:MAG: hypothetical protein ACP5OA_07310 [Candidatus Woesearchaeota archaeon]